jgi:hypothetical protein
MTAVSREMPPRAAEDEPTTVRALENGRLRVVEEALRDAAQRWAKGDRTPLARLLPAPRRRGRFRFQTDLSPVPPLDPIALDMACVGQPPYLADNKGLPPDQMNGFISYNRFTWWDKVTSTNWFASVPNGNAVPPPGAGVLRRLRRDGQGVHLRVQPPPGHHRRGARRWDDGGGLYCDLLGRPGRSQPE